MARAMPTWTRWTWSRAGSAAFWLVLTFLIGFAMALGGSSSWCSTVGGAIIDGRVAQVDGGAVTRGQLVELAGEVLWALPWATLAVLRRHRRLELAAYVIVAALVMLWGGALFWTAVSDPLKAEGVRCWHF